MGIKIEPIGSHETNPFDLKLAEQEFDTLEQLEVYHRQVREDIGALFVQKSTDLYRNHMRCLEDAERFYWEYRRKHFDDKVEATYLKGNTMVEFNWVWRYKCGLCGHKSKYYGWQWFTRLLAIGHSLFRHPFGDCTIEAVDTVRHDGLH